MSLVKEVSFADNQKWVFEFNKYAKQAGGSVMVSSGGTQVLVTACASSEPKENQSFFPLSVDYTQKLYSCGRIPGGYNKREGRPSVHETLTARVIDRQLRPCFPDGFLNDTVIQCTVMSYDGKNNPVPLAMVGASTALMISEIPFNGPVAGLCVSMDEKSDESAHDKAKYAKFSIDTNIKDDQKSDLDLIVAAKPEALLMVEASANFLPEQTILDAISYARESMKPLFDIQIEMQKFFNKEKLSFEKAIVSSKVMDLVESLGTELISQAFSVQQKQQRMKSLKQCTEQICESVLAKLSQESEDSQDVAQLDLADDSTKKMVLNAIDDLKYKLMRHKILDDNKRIDNRSFTDIREITTEIGVLSCAHGSSLFTRGETQALCALTLGAPIDRQRFETLDNKDADDYFMLHYNFPSYCVGEAQMPRSTSRREIGHGALAKKAFLHALPDQADFGYVIRLVSEVLESNGSSSMATVCASSLAMFHGGVPLKKHIAGIAMGLVKEGDKYAVLTDILGDEDHLGDMDFKVCGSEDGVSALQMDIKVDGITEEILTKALDQAKTARLSILKNMNESVSSPNELSKLAPQMFKLKIDANKVRDIIGPGGKTIKKIVAETGVSIDIEDNGVVSIVAMDSTSAEATKSMIRHITADPKAGEIYLGKVTKIMDFGCFVEIKPGLEGLVHISQIDNQRINQVSDYVSENEEILVKVIDIDRQGRIKLSRKDAIGQKPTFELKA